MFLKLFLQKNGIGLLDFSACDNVWIELNCPVLAQNYLGIWITYAYVAFIKPALVFKIIISKYMHV